jgi:hypothetical protein
MGSDTLMSTVTNNDVSNIFSPLDPCYTCLLCSKSLRYSSKLKAVVEINNYNSEHMCNRKTEKRDVLLNSQQAEIDTQQEFYQGQFHSSAVFRTNRNIQIKDKERGTKQKQPRTMSQEQKQKIAEPMRNKWRGKK